MMRKVMMIVPLLLICLSFENYVCSSMRSNRFRLSLMLLKASNLNNKDNSNNSSSVSSTNTIGSQSNDIDCTDGVCVIKPKGATKISGSLQDQVISDWKEAIVTSEYDNQSINNKSITSIIDQEENASATTASNTTTASSSTPSPTVEADKSQIDELIKLGWSARDAERALIASNNDLVSAAGLLESEEEQAEELRGKVEYSVRINPSTMIPIYSSVCLLYLSFHTRLCDQ